jgi:ornithine carbamoyltransferase
MLPSLRQGEKMTTSTLVTPISLSNDLLTGAEWSPSHTRDLLQLSAEIKARPGRYASSLTGKFIALIFEKPSLRTRVTFDVGIQSMGGSVVFLDHTQASASLGARESIADVARNLDRWVHGIVARVYKQKVLEEMAANAGIPVINALSDKFHPCQALADFFTLEERFGALRGFKLTYVGDGNNVCHSLMLAGALLGVHVTIATPKNFEPKLDIIHKAIEIAESTGGSLTLTHDPIKAATNADAVYTDVCTSMGQEHEAARRAPLFKPFQVNDALMSHTNSGAVFMHCLPAHRNAEVTDSVLDGPQSIVFDQAENRLHAQKAVALMLLGGAKRIPKSNRRH